MRFKLCVVGKIKEAYFRQAIEEYTKRLSRFATVDIVEVDECLFRGTPSEAEIKKIVEDEGARLLRVVEGCVVVLDIGGKQPDSEELSAELFRRTQNYSTFSFVIGGSHGLSQAVRARADMRVSFGKITLPHQLCRVVLCEQLYRACCIHNNVPYHK